MHMNGVVTVTKGAAAKASSRAHAAMLRARCIVAGKLTEQAEVAEAEAAC
jgi:hypothetical protein